MFCSQDTVLDEVDWSCYSFEARASVKSFYASQNFLKNAIKEIQELFILDCGFWEYVSCFCLTLWKILKIIVTNGIFNDFKNNIDAWILQCAYATQARVYNNKTCTPKMGTVILFWIISCQLILSVNERSGKQLEVFTTTSVRLQIFRKDQKTSVRHALLAIWGYFFVTSFVCFLILYFRLQ